MNGFDYAQARMQARHGARPDASTWAHAHAAASLDALLEVARRSTLSAWSAGLESEGSEAARERHLRERLRLRIAEVARWLPPEWQDAMLATRTLIDLPALQYLASGRPALAWMREEPTLRDALASEADPSRAPALREQWLAAWQARWPTTDASARAGMERLVTLLRAHVTEFARLPADEARAAREHLARELVRLFRAEALAPAAAFAHVALLALDAEHVRAEIAAHAMPEAAA